MKFQLSATIAWLLVFAVQQDLRGEVLRWEYSGRLVDVVDPDGIFLGLRTGDPVEGHFQYDTSLEPLDFFGVALFGHDDESAGLIDFPGLSFRATNPRTEEVFSPKPTFEFLDDLIVSVGNDFEDTDAIGMFQGFQKPEGYRGDFVPAVSIDMLGPSDLYDTNLILPTEFDLENFAAVGAYFGDLDFAPEFGQLSAVIFELNPVELMPGDFSSNFEITPHDIDLLNRAIHLESTNGFYDLNADELVDENDRVAWITDIANTVTGDADLNGKVEFADFLALSESFGEDGGWANGNFDLEPSVAFADFLLLSSHFGNDSEEVTSIPEPASVNALFVGLLALMSHLPRRSRLGVAK